MVKNTTGGTGTKSVARKHQGKPESKLVIASDEYQRYGLVSKLYGNCMCQITFNDSSTLIGHIRKKFTGRNKRHHFISVNAIVLVSLRDFEKPAKNCDIIHIYDDMYVQQLHQTPGVHIENLLRVRNEYTNDSVDFIHGEEGEDEDSGAAISSSSAMHSTDDSIPDFSIDDI